MPTHVRILGEWDMVLPDPVEGRPWFLDWVLKSPTQVSRHLTAGWLVMNHLRVARGVRPRSVVEYFGGMGAQALMVEEVFEPTSRHLVYDYSADAVTHMQREFEGKIPARAEVRDSYDPANTTPADLVVLDFGDLTASKLRDGYPHAALLERVVLLGPQAIMLTDTAGHFLHLHRDHYDAVLGEGASATYETYIEALSRYLEDRWGYTTVVGYRRRWSTVLGLMPTERAARGVIRETPETPVGLVVLR